MKRTFLIRLANYSDFSANSHTPVTVYDGCNLIDVLAYSPLSAYQAFKI